LPTASFATFVTVAMPALAAMNPLAAPAMLRSLPLAPLLASPILPVDVAALSLALSTFVTLPAAVSMLALKAA
jgi:hypothetical protein